MTCNGKPAAPPPVLELWLCSTNPAKLRQLTAALGASCPARVLLHVVTDPAGLPEVIEDRADALGNARKKAAAFAAATGRPCLAMDASLLLPGLPAADQPGVNVRRLPGAAHRPDDDEVLAYYTRLTERNGGRLRARWVFGLAIGMPDGEVLDATAVTERVLVAPPCAARQPGYPLNSLQQDPATDRYLAELTEPEATALQAEAIGGPLRDLAARARDGRLNRVPAQQPATGGGPAPAASQPDSGTQAAGVTAFWRELDLPGLIDIHVHFMPPNVLAKVWAYFEHGKSGQPWPIYYRQPEDERVALLRAFGVRRFGALSYPHKPDMAAWLNSWAAGFAARTPDALHSATFFPEPAAAGYVTEAIAAGARLFKAHLQVGGYDPRDDLLAPVWGLLAEAGVPVVVHCGSGPMPGPYTGPGPISQVLARHPRLIVIIAHLGTPEYREFLDLADRRPGVYLDTTMTFTDFTERTAPFPAALRPRLAAAADRILLGTDFPNIPYPYLRQLEALARLELGPDWLRAVCYQNAAALLGL